MSKYSWKQYVIDYWQLLEGRRLKFSIYTILRSFTNLLNFLLIYFLGMIIDFFTTYNQGDSLNNFYYLTLAIALAGSLQVWLRFFAKVRMQTIGAQIRKETRVKAMQKLMSLDLKWHEKEDTGSKIHKINNGCESIFTGIRNFSNSGISIIVSLFGSIIIFLTLNYKYAIFSIIFATIYLLTEKHYNKKLHFWQDKFSKIKEKVVGKLHESASNVLTVKSLGLKEVFSKSAQNYEDKYYNIWLKQRNVSENKLKTIKISSSIIKAIFILIIGFDFINGKITLGSILVYSNYFSKLVSALHELTHNMATYINNRSGLERFMTIFGKEIIDREKDKIKFSKSFKKIELIDLHFKYKKADVLKGINLTINKGEKIGVVGKSGSGKSTISKLLLGLYNSNKGKILFDKKPIQSYSHNSITNNISIVLQESEMFNLSLLENVTISSTKNNLERFKLASKIANLEPIIEKLPLGLNTKLGEKGYHLSGGERQRVGIARAIYKDNSILILDEATSSLDSKTESLIQKELEKNLKNKTLIIIAHRLSTLKHVDRIIVIDKGKVIEQGRFNQLIKNKGLFSKLYRLQKNR